MNKEKIIKNIIQSISQISILEADKDIQNLISGNRSFVARNLANYNIDISKWIVFLKENNILFPRTGHLGCWRDIRNFQSGSLDYNSILCFSEKIAYPLIFDLGLSENEDLTSGDTIYLPGSILKNGKRYIRDLRLNPELKSIYSREKSYFLPYLVENKDGVINNLSITLKREIDTDLKEYVHYFQSNEIFKNRKKIKEIFECIIEEFCKTENKKILCNFVDRYIDDSGQIQRDSIHYRGNEFIVGKRIFSKDQFLESLWYPILSSNNIEFGNKLEFVPLISNHTMQILLSFLFKNICRFGSNEVHVHVQWGAIGMSGIGPYQKSYFSHNTKRLRQLYDILVKNNIVGPTLFIVIPSIPFLLLPMKNSHADVNIIQDIVDFLNNQGGSDLSLEKAESIKSHLLSSGIKFEKLSEYYKSRFRKLRSPLHGIENIHDNIPLNFSDVFTSLSFKDAVMLVGILRSILKI
ncbi:MAG: hypothetical protein KDC90_08085 [Ignavibacteriae bacterium]|nr:hypothetical protein [Ignavibacteriota bacterium]